MQRVESCPEADALSKVLASCSLLVLFALKPLAGTAPPVRALEAWSVYEPLWGTTLRALGSVLRSGIVLSDVDVVLPQTD